MGLNLGAGVDQHVNPGVTATWVFTPTPSASATVRLYNEGSQPVYVGQVNVTPYNGLPLFPNNRPIELVNINQNVYACSGVAVTTTGNTIQSSTAGTLVFTMGTTTSFPAGTVMVVGSTLNTSSLETFTVSGTTATAVTVSTAALYDHAAGTTVRTATAIPAQLRVTAGVV